MTDIIAQFKKIVGDTHVLTGSDAESYFREYAGRYQGKGMAAIRPANTQEVSDIVKICAANNVPIVPQGGNTGLVGGSVPYQDNAIVLSLSRMNRVREINPENFSMTVEAGCILEQMQNLARDHKRYLPLLIASQGSAQIGGAIAVNAGGILTIRYGNTRDLVLGLEVVMPDGQIWNGLRSLRKDNMGYNLKHLFIGSEGTLGIITAAVLKLVPDPGHVETFFAGMESLDTVVSLLSALRDAFGENIQAYEVISRDGVDAVLGYAPQCIEPLSTKAPWNLLVEVTGHDDHLRDKVENFLATQMEKGLVLDATIAQSEAQRMNFWLIRESASGAAQNYPGGSIKHDVAVPIASMPDFVREADAVVADIIPQAKVVNFGHAGDGNLHYDVIQDAGLSKQEFLGMWDQVSHAVHDIAVKYGGSICAEHGVGIFKVEEIAERRSSVEIDMMHRVKQALDPQGIMNPGKVLR